MSKQFEIYQSIYNALDRYCDDHPERAADFVDFLSDANPHIWGGESSGDPAIYDGYLDFISKLDYESLSVFQIAKLYFAQLDDYYGDTIRFISSLSEEEFNDLLSKSS